MIEDIWRTDAWSRGIVDQRGDLSHQLWRAITQAIYLENQKQLVAEARPYDALQDEVDARQQLIDQREADLAAAATKIESLLQCARGIDERSTKATNDRVTEARRRQEEERIRARLLGEPSLTNESIPIEFDSLEEIVAETEAINRFLKESDELLRRIV